MRLALRGVFPKILDRELAVRYLHEEAKSADPSRFAAEWRKVVPELAAELTRRDRVHSAATRARSKITRLVPTWPNPARPRADERVR